MCDILTGYRFRVYPNRVQSRELIRTSGAVRWVYNEMLRYRDDCWIASRSAGANGFIRGLGYIHMSEVLTSLRNNNQWLSEVSIIALRGSLKNLDSSFNSFFRGTGGYPKLKKLKEGVSISYLDSSRISIRGDSIVVPKIGSIKIKIHRNILGSIKSATISRHGRHWYVGISSDGLIKLSNTMGSPVGVDLGVRSSVTTSTGGVMNFAVPTRKELNRIKFFQRQSARRKKKSARQNRSYIRLSVLKRNAVNRRRDCAHKASNKIATRHSIVVIEDLKISNMTRSAKGTKEKPGKNVKAKAGLNRSMLEQGHADFARMLAYKCERSGAKLVRVNPAYTSQTCSQCGHCAKENRESQAKFLCVACGHQQNADHNAALNILAAGLAVIARGGSGNSLAVEPRSDPQYIAV